MTPANPPPTYPLEHVKELVRRRAYNVTTYALHIAGAVGFNSEDIDECLSRLELTDFYKSIESKERPGQWLDVYRPFFRGQRLYVKLMVSSKTILGDLVVVLSFNLK